MGPFVRVVCFLALFAVSASSTNLPAFKNCVNGYLKTSKSPKLTLIYSGASLYQTFQQRIFNTRFTWQKPAVIAFPVWNADVSALIKCANKAALRFVARDGGHSYEGLSSLNNGMVVDLSKINFINVDKAARLATIGAGQRLGPVYRSLFEQGGFMIPGGTCIAVGISGLTLGGGIGANTRKLGLTSDLLKSATVVTATGAILTASATANPDLFFAIRGGGGNFGIVTTWTFRLTPVPSKVTVLEVSWQDWQFKDVMTAIGAWKPWRLPTTYSNVEWFYGFGSIKLTVYYWGPKADLEALLLAPSTPYKAVDGYTINTFSEFSYKDYVLHYTNFQGEADWTFERVFTLKDVVRRQWGPNPSSGWEATSFKGGSIMLNADLPAAGIQAFEKAKQANANGWLQGRALRGVHAKPAIAATAYPHRKAVWEVQAYTSVSSDADVSWVRETARVMREGKFSTGNEYVNYLDCGGNTNPWTTYFASNAPRLKEIKAKFDPGNNPRFNALSCH